MDERERERELDLRLGSVDNARRQITVIGLYGPKPAHICFNVQQSAHAHELCRKGGWYTKRMKSREVAARTRRKVGHVGEHLLPQPNRVMVSLLLDGINGEAESCPSRG